MYCILKQYISYTIIITYSNTPTITCQLTLLNLRFVHTALQAIWHKTPPIYIYLDLLLHNIFFLSLVISSYSFKWSVSTCTSDGIITKHTINIQWTLIELRAQKMNLMCTKNHFEIIIIIIIIICLFCCC